MLVGSIKSSITEFQPPKRENFGRLKLFLLLEANFETQGVVRGFLNAKLVMVAIFTSGKNWHPMGCLVN